MKEIKPIEQQFVDKYIENGNNATQAVKDVYKITNDNYAKLKGHRKLKSKNVQKAIKSIADQIPDKLLIKKHLELLNSKERTIIEGEVISESINVQGVSKGLDMAYKLKGTYAEEKIKVNGEVNIISFRDQHSNK